MLYVMNLFVVLLEDENPADRSFFSLLRGPGRQTKNVRDIHRSADPLHFTLLHPTGTNGYNLGMHPAVSPREYYAYQMQHRYRSDPAGASYNNIYNNILLRACRLFHEYACVMFAKIENQRLVFIKNNQRKLRG